MLPASEQTVQQLRAEILDGRLVAGERLGEVQLADRLAVSRTPVREALTRLAAEGLVDLVPNRGARVRRWTEKDLREIFELRLRLEPFAVRQAVPRATPTHLDELQEMATAMKRIARPGRGQDLDGVFELNRHFHRTLITLADNPPIAAALKSVTHASVVHRNYHDYTPEALARSMAHHVEIVAAARAGDPDWAESVMRAHLFNARATMLERSAA